MDWYTAADRLIKQYRSSPPTIAEGMEGAIRALTTKKNKGAAAALAAIDWGAEVGAFSRWVAASATKNRLPDDIAGLWFCVPEIDLNPPDIYFIGSRSFDERESGSEWATDSAWAQVPPRRRDKRHPPEFASRVLARVQRLLKIGPGTDPEPEESDAAEPLYGGLPMVYVHLLVRETLAAVPAKTMLGGRGWRGVGLGYVSGDMHIAGVLTREGWATPGPKYRFEHVEEVKRLHSDPRLDLNSEDLNLRAYLKAGLDVNARSADGETPLLMVLGDIPSRIDFRLARRLIENGADVTVESRYKVTPLLRLLDGPISLVQLALDRGADPNARNDNGIAPIHSAVGHRAKAAKLQLLLQYGADANLKGMFGRTPLHKIADYGHPSYARSRPTARLIRLLLDHGADLEVRDVTGATPLMHAVVRYAEYHRSDSPDSGAGHGRVAMMLLKAGADPNCRITRSPHPLIPDGGTPLMCGRYDDGKLHLALLRAGADPGAKSAKGLTALDYAKQALRKPKLANKKGVERVIAALEAALAAGRGGKARKKAGRAP